MFPGCVFGFVWFYRQQIVQALIFVCVCVCLCVKVLKIPLHFCEVMHFTAK